MGLSGVTSGTEPSALPCPASARKPATSPPTAASHTCTHVHTHAHLQAHAGSSGGTGSQWQPHVPKPCRMPLNFKAPASQGREKVPGNSRDHLCGNLQLRQEKRPGTRRPGSVRRGCQPVASSVLTQPSAAVRGQAAPPPHSSLPPALPALDLPAIPSRLCLPLGPEDSYCPTLPLALSVPHKMPKKPDYPWLSTGDARGLDDHVHSTLCALTPRRLARSELCPAGLEGSPLPHVLPGWVLGGCRAPEVRSTGAGPTHLCL